MSGHVEAALVTSFLSFPIQSLTSQSLGILCSPRMLEAVREWGVLWSLPPCWG